MAILPSVRPALAAGGLAALLLLAACGGGGASHSTSPSGGAPNLNLALTDAPSDAWAQVTVQLQSASLIPQGSGTPVQVWPASGAPAGTTAPVNLVDLSSVATLLGTVSAVPGSYTALRLAIDPDPASMTLVDDNGATIPASEIAVKGNGVINVALAPAFVVPASGTATLQADFNLADPLSIAETTVGGVTKVVLDLQVRFKALPADLRTLQFARKLGAVAQVAAPDFTITDHSGHSFTYQTDAGTLFRDADARSAGDFAGLAGKYALVASNLNADGSLYARRVWYAASAATLPVWTPEGLVRRVFPNQDKFTVFSQATNAANSAVAWSPQTVLVDANTVWTFHTSVAMGTGTGFLQDIWRGCRVDVEFDHTGTTAASVNVESAFDEGFIGAATATDLTFGWPAMAAPPMAGGVGRGLGDLAARSWAYYQPSGGVEAFSWWYFGLPSSADASVQDLLAVIAASRTAKLPVAGFANLHWDTVSQTWQVYQLVLEPERLNTSVITTAYTDGGSGSGTMGVTCLTPFSGFSPASATPMTLTLDYTGELQTVVESATYTRSTNVFTFVAPVPASGWAALLVPPAQGTLGLDQIWVRPVLDSGAIDWHAYTVGQFTVQ